MLSTRAVKQMRRAVLRGGRQQSQVSRAPGRLEPGVRAHPAHELLDLGLDGGSGVSEEGADLGIRLPLLDEQRHLDLPVGQGDRHDLPERPIVIASLIGLDREQPESEGGRDTVECGDFEGRERRAAGRTEGERPDARTSAHDRGAHQDAVVIGPGSLYTSIIANFLVRGIVPALRRLRVRWGLPV